MENRTLRKVSNDFQISGLNRVFSSEELGTSETVQYETTAILGYFATSLFDKNKEKDILWDITKNCIAKLNLEDCVIYMLDEKRQVLVQKAAYGNKDKGERKILSPIEIKLGEGIVGHVANTGKLEVVSDAVKDERYILDDRQRQSELAVPITCGKTLIGVLDSEHSNKDFFREKHVFLFRLIAKLIATKLAQIVKKSSLQLTNDNAYYQDLCRLLNTEKIYQDPELSLTAVAEKLNISSTYLSQLVNQCNKKNFSEFINSYRVRDAEYMLMDSDFSNYTILSIGLEAGFNSKSTFYAAFKKYTGVTPTQYREKRLLVS